MPESSILAPIVCFAHRSASAALEHGERGLKTQERGARGVALRLVNDRSGTEITSIVLGKR